MDIIERVILYGKSKNYKESCVPCSLKKASTVEFEQKTFYRLKTPNFEG